MASATGATAKLVPYKSRLGVASTTSARAATGATDDTIPAALSAAVLPAYATASDAATT